MSLEGASVALAITGELPIWDVTQSVTFDVTLEIASLERPTGQASATVLLSDLALSIPSVPDVAEAAEG